MKNKKAVIVIILTALFLISGVAAFKALSFGMEKYHFLRDKITEIDANTSDQVRKYDLDYSWMDDSVLVAHALGGKGTKVYTNALESFLYNYELGYRIFEVDFDLTTDLQTICCHDEDWWRYITNNEESGVEYSYENFKNTPLFTDYTPLDYKDIVDLLCEYPDIYIVTDTKYSDETRVFQQFSQIVDYAEKTDPEVLDRIIPQIYTKEMLDDVMTVHQFRSIIFTLYQISWEAEDIAGFCIKSGIDCITVSSGAVDDDVLRLWDSMRINVAVHTINDKAEADAFLDKGVSLIYSDFLEPEVFH